MFRAAEKVCRPLWLASQAAAESTPHVCHVCTALCCNTGFMWHPVGAVRVAQRHCGPLLWGTALGKGVVAGDSWRGDGLQPLHHPYTLQNVWGHCRHRICADTKPGLTHQAMLVVWLFGDAVRVAATGWARAWRCAIALLASTFISSCRDRRSCSALCVIRGLSGGFQSVQPGRGQDVASAP